MKGIEKITSVRLAEILSDRGSITTEVITDALYAQERHGEPFAQLLVSGGHITEWDLAKIVTENFNLPFLMAGNYNISEEAKVRLPKTVLFEHTIVPLDLFGDILCIAMPVMLTFATIASIQKDFKCDLFPYVGLITENKKVIGEMHKDYAGWLTEEQKRKEQATRKRSNPFAKGADWMSIFDAGDMAIQAGNKKKAQAAPPSSPPSQAQRQPPKPPKK
ncbi:MAG TPA: hypothetical protein VF384_07615 [Planctomycetota bacterium]